ncbi:MAG: hypothetical protein AAB692_01755 [Patescibacteria group bacterium]
MRSKFAFFFACAFLPLPSVVGRAEPSERVAVGVSPRVGETVVFEADAVAYDLRNTLRDVTVRVGDHDDKRFEMDCRLAPPFTVRVLGSFETTVVLRHTAPKRQNEFFDCNDNGVITVSLNGWVALKKAEAEIAAAKAAKERRRTTIRDIVNSGSPGQVK